MTKLNQQFEQLDEEVLENLIIKLRLGQATKQDKECIYNSHAKLAIAIAKDYKYKVPQKIREDIYGEALYALSKAIDEAPKKLINNNFTKFCKYRILTLIRNFIRKELKQGIIKSTDFNDYTEELAKFDFGQNTYDLKEELNKIILLNKHKIIIKYLLEGYTKKEIAKVLLVSEPRINQFCNEIKDKILKRNNAFTYPTYRTMP